MHMKNRRPSFAPLVLCDLPKGDLADLVWCLAQRCNAESADDDAETWATIIAEYTAQAAQTSKPKLSHYVLTAAKAAKESE